MDSLSKLEEEITAQTDSENNEIEHLKKKLDDCKKLISNFYRTKESFDISSQQFSLNNK